jgi:hypothetical protein
MYGKVNPWLIAVTITLATIMEVLGTSIANVALPHIAGAMDASQDESTWISYVPPRGERCSVACCCLYRRAGTGGIGLLPTVVSPGAI